MWSQAQEAETQTRQEFGSPCRLLAEGVEKRVWVEELWQVECVRQESLLLSPLYPALEGKEQDTHSFKNFVNMENK